MLIAILEDLTFKKRTREPYHKRWTVRCFVYDKDDKLVFLRIKGMDAFGIRNHIETIGGGIESNESLEDAVHREIAEEIGYTCEIIDHIGYIVDHYNVLNRETISTFFVVRLKEFIGSNRTLEEQDLIDGVETFKEDDVLHYLSKVQKRTVNELVQRRDRIALQHYLKHRKKD